MHQAVNIRQSSSSRKAKTLRKIRESKANGEAHYDQGREQQIESRGTVRQALWEAHVRSNVSALEEALTEKNRRGKLKNDPLGNSRPQEKLTESHLSSHFFATF